MTIECGSLEDYLNVIQGLAFRGIGFKSQVGATYWRITLTGAF